MKIVTKSCGGDCVCIALKDRVGIYHPPYGQHKPSKDIKLSGDYYCGSMVHIVTNNLKRDGHLYIGEQI